MAHAQETRFFLSAKQTSRFKLAGASVQAITGSRGGASAVVTLDTQCSEVVWRVLATHSICQFPPSLLLPCVTVCHHVSTGLCFRMFINTLISRIFSSPKTVFEICDINEKKRCVTQRAMSSVLLAYEPYICITNWTNTVITYHRNEQWNWTLPLVSTHMTILFFFSSSVNLCRKMQNIKLTWWWVSHY
jgi:hypothetical protein